MKKAFTSGMILFLAMTTMVSCTQENVMLETTPQVKNQEVRFCFFEKSIVPIGQDEESNLARTRADGSKQSLKDAKLYTDLQVCLIPKGDETTAGYTVRQENWDDKFGNVSLQVPAGEYTLVAVAAYLSLIRCPTRFHRAAARASAAVPEYPVRLKSEYSDPTVRFFHGRSDLSLPAYRSHHIVSAIPVHDRCWFPYPI